MDARGHGHGTAAGRLRRLALVLCGAAVFVGIASVIKPSPRQASADPQAPVPTGRLMTNATGRGTNLMTHPEGWKCLGYVESREYVVVAFASPDGPRYTIRSKDGVIMIRDLPSDEVYRAVPDIDLENLRVDPPTGDMLMMHSGGGSSALE